MSSIIWVVLIGFIAGLIALSPGPNVSKGFILTTVLGIAGAFIATFIGQTVGWYRLDQGAGLIGATIGALVVLFVWNRRVAHHIADRGQAAFPEDEDIRDQPRRLTWDCSTSSMECKMVLAVHNNLKAVEAVAACRRSRRLSWDW